LYGPAAGISSEKKLRALESYGTIDFDDGIVRQGVSYVLVFIFGLVFLSDVTALLFNITNDFHLKILSKTYVFKKPFHTFG
jgi:hypothetical protein